MKKLSLMVAIFCFISVICNAALPKLKKSAEAINTTLAKIEIADNKVAKACGITEIKKGFPKEGKITISDNKELRLRDYPWGNVLGLYKNGASLQVLGEAGEFYLVEIDGIQGYMHKNFVSTPDKKAINQEPYYPGNTRSGGALPLKEGIKASKDGASGKIPNVNISGNSVCLNHVAECYQCNTNCPSPGTACGPTSLAMCFSYYGMGDPYSMFPNIYHECGCTTGGTDAKNLIDVARKHGFSRTDIHWRVNYDYCREQLRAGKPMIAIVEHHYVVMKGIDANGNVLINDPAGPFRGHGVSRTMSPSEFTAWWNKGSACSVIVVEK